MKRVKKEDDALLEVLSLLQRIEPKDILALIKEKQKHEQLQKAQTIPVSLFSAVPLSSLEAIVVYLRDHCHLTFPEIGTLLGRNPIALNTSYHQAKKKYDKPFSLPESPYHIPCSVFANKTLSVLEHIVFYLKNEYKLSNSHIAKLLNKDQRTIWTVCDRAKRKEVRS